MSIVHVCDGCGSRASREHAHTNNPPRDWYEVRIYGGPTRPGAYDVLVACSHKCLVPALANWQSKLIQLVQGTA